MEVKTTKAAQTKKIAQQLAKELKGGDTIALFGDLGAGKTIFAQGIAKGLGIKKRVLSPTFVFMRSYPFTKGNLQLTFYHLDLYRGGNWQDFESLGLSDIFAEDSIIVIEWAEKIEQMLPKDRIDVRFKILSEKERKISIKRKR